MRAGATSEIYIGERLDARPMATPPRMRYLMHARMTRACALLDSTDKSVAEISSEVGFRDAFHFTKTFRAVVGSSPRAYRLASAADFAVGSGPRR
jgi:AraC-like DNA-binding protein